MKPIKHLKWTAQGWVEVDLDIDEARQRQRDCHAARDAIRAVTPFLTHPRARVQLAAEILVETLNQEMGLAPTPPKDDK